MLSGAVVLVALKLKVRRVPMKQEVDDTLRSEQRDAEV